MDLPRRLVVLASAALAVALPTASAHAAQRFSAPTATATAGSCSETAPCRLDAAVGGAVTGDEVVLAPGTYEVSFELQAKGIVLRGTEGRPRPRLVGTGTLTESTLQVDKGGVARHLEVQATAPGQRAFEIEGGGGLGERLLVRSATGDGARINASDAGSVLRDSVVQTGSGAADDAAVFVRDSGQGVLSVLVNVTAWAPAGAQAVRCDATKSRAIITSVVARGKGADIAGSSTPGACRVSHSNYRAEMSPRILAGPGDQNADPRLGDPGAGNFGPLDGSPLIDAGNPDGAGHLGAKDLAGRARVAGAGPDIGAYEHVPGTPTEATEGGDHRTGDEAASGDGEGAGTSPNAPGATELPRGAAPPVLGRTVVVAPAAGVVRVRVPGARQYARLAAGDDIPVGALVDTRAGAVRLSTALPGDAGYQTATFGGGVFSVRQSRRGRGMADIVLRGGNFERCRSRASRAAARSRTVRRLWARDRRGRFRTHGRNSVATVRGTRWVTIDRCDGTLTRVLEGAVDVRDRHRGTTRRVRAGSSLLVRARRR